MDLKQKTRKCPGCLSGEVSRRLAEKIDKPKITEMSYASRKVPELMHRELWQCSGCETLYSPILETESAMIPQYQNASYDSSEEAQDAARTYVVNLKHKLNLDGKKILDVGTGDGAFLNECLKEKA